MALGREVRDAGRPEGYMLAFAAVFMPLANPAIVAAACPTRRIPAAGDNYAFPPPASGDGRRTELRHDQFRLCPASRPGGAAEMSGFSLAAGRRTGTAAYFGDRVVSGWRSVG